DKQASHNAGKHFVADCHLMERFGAGLRTDQDIMLRSEADHLLGLSTRLYYKSMRETQLRREPMKTGDVSGKWVPTKDQSCRLAQKSYRPEDQIRTRVRAYSLAKPI